MTGDVQALACVLYHRTVQHTSLVYITVSVIFLLCRHVYLLVCEYYKKAV